MNLNLKTLAGIEKKECPYHNVNTSKVNCGSCRDARSFNQVVDLLEKKEVSVDEDALIHIFKNFKQE